MKYALFILVFVLSSFVVPQSSFAATSAPNCTPLYGGGQSCAQNDPILINKQVQNPQTKAYVDNLSATDPQYGPGQTVLFKIMINNNSKNTVSNITASDIFPSYIDYFKGSGSYDVNTRALTFAVGQLKGNETKVFYVEGHVVNKDALPQSQQARCVINQALVVANNKTSQDNSLICLTTDENPTTTTNQNVTSGGLVIHPPSQVKTTPGTGPEAFAIFGLLPLGGLGFFLRSKAKT